MAGGAYVDVARVYEKEPRLKELDDLSSLAIFGYIEDAEAIIDARIAPQYSLPVSSGVGHIPVLTAIATDMTLYLIYRRQFNRERLKDSGWPATFKAAEDMLKEIVDGGVPLINSAGTIIGARTDVADVWSSTQDYQPTHSILDTVEHVIDPDRVDDERDNRDLGIARTILE